MAREEMIADERYHVCGRCKWENIPFICHQCKWGEDTRKDLWNLKEDEMKAKNVMIACIPILLIGGKKMQTQKG